ncbi:MAG TPA: DUF1636 domain-containing protein [Beijerinckiaceae bacterium]|nr:DUF1636 domain-containing protein [Beijerinckiaceae bacterium]
MSLPQPDPVKTLVYVCVTCRPADLSEQQRQRPGADLYEALSARAARDPTVEILPVECLSVCKRPCTIGFAAPGKWTYVYGDLPPDVGAEVILAGARLYADSPDGLIPWKLRPRALKKGVVARIPPLPAPHLVSDIQEAAE